MAKQYEPIDPEQIVSYGIRVIPDREVLDGVFGSVVDSVANGISNTEIRGALEKQLERYNSRYHDSENVTAVVEEAKEP